MKRLVFLLSLLLISTLFVFPLGVSSQDFDYKKSYEDYLFALDAYRKEHTEFKNARDFYLQTKTLGLKEAARKETFDMLLAREELVAVYLITLRMKLIDTPDHPGTEKGDILGDLLPESKWFRDYKSTYQKDDDTIETLFGKSEEANDEYEKRTKPLIYKTLGTIAFSKYLDVKISHENIYKEIKPQIDALEGARRALFDRWVTDTDSEFQKVTDIEIAAKAIRDKLKANDKNPEESYKNLISELSEGNKSFKAINGYLQEMIVALHTENGN